MKEQAKDKFQRMTTEPIPKLVCTLAVPTIISMLVTSVYNMADTYFVGKIETAATAAVGVSFSLMALIQALGFMMGMGSGNLISRLLGAQQGERAKQVAAGAFFSTFLAGILIAITGTLFLDPIVRILGATDTIAPHAKSYIGIILIGVPFMASSFVLNNLLRYQGSAFYGMLGIGAGGILNIVLDPLFIFYFDMGVSGAAAATVISPIVSFVILLICCGRGGNIRIDIREFKAQLTIYKEIIRLGAPSFYRQGLASIAVLSMNQCARPYGDAAIAAMSIVSRVFMFALSILLGFGQGFQPVSGFNYGAKLYGRVREAFLFCVKVAVVVLTVLAVVGFVWAPDIIAAFRKDDLEVIQIGTRALRFQCVTFPLSAWVVMCNMLTQSIGKTKSASVLAMLRQGIFFLPALFVLTPLIGLLGIQLSQPIADVGTFLVALPIGIKAVLELKEA